MRPGGTCRIAFWHRARFSAARHGDQPDTAPLWNAVRGRARLVLSGHDHASQRFRADRGTIQLVAGAGGHERYAVRDDPRLRFADDDRDAALRLRLEPGVARFAFVDAHGSELHAGRVRCQAP